MKVKALPKLNPDPKPAKTKGPVENLEKHLHPDWWKRIFNSMYLKTDADVVEDNRITESEVSLFKRLLAIKEGESILDLACGQGRHIIELGQRGNFKLFGLDRSRYLIQRGKSVAKKKACWLTLRKAMLENCPMQLIL